jgi:hypothetical protein
MRVRCLRCAEEVVVDDLDARCPKCLRRSTLVAAKSLVEPSPRAPAERKLPPGMQVVGAVLALVLVFVARLDAGSDPITLPDLSVCALTAGWLAYMNWATRFRFAAARRDGVALVFGFVLGALALAALAGVVALAMDPWVLSGGRKMKSVHNFSLAFAVLGIAITLGALAASLVRNAWPRRASPSTGTLEPLASAAVEPDAPRTYRRTAPARIVTLADVRSTLASLPRLRVALRGDAVVVHDRENHRSLTLAVEDAGSVRLGAVTITAMDETLALEVSHALVSVLGPHRLVLEENDIVIDGERSLDELHADHLRRLAVRLELGMREIDALRARMR